jgi:hypothetical protein
MDCGCHLSNPGDSRVSDFLKDIEKNIGDDVSEVCTENVGLRTWKIGLLHLVQAMIV